MTKYASTLFAAALTMVVANPALACGSAHARPHQTATAPKKTALAGLRTESPALGTTAESVPSGLSTDLLGS